VVPPCNTLLRPWALKRFVRKREGFGGLSADGEIRRSINVSVRERLSDVLRIHPRAEHALFCASG